MNIKRKTKPEDQEKLFGDLNSLEREGKELIEKIDGTLEKIRDYKKKRENEE